MCEKYSRTTHSDNRSILSYKYYEFMDGDGAGPVGLAYIEESVSICPLPLYA